MVLTIVLGYFTSCMVRLKPAVPMTGQGFVVPVWTCAEPSAQNSIVCTLPKSTSRGSVCSGPSLFGIAKNSGSLSG